MEATPTEIQYRFAQRRTQLKELFAEDLSESQRLELDWHSYLRHLFEQVEAVLDMKEVVGFQRYLQNQDNLPAHINPLAFRFEHFEEMLSRWLEYRKLTVADMAESFYISEEEAAEQKEYRNREFKDVLRCHQALLAEFTSGQRQKKKLADKQLLQLLHRLFSEIFVYQYDSDDVPLCDKPNFHQTAREVLRRYKYSPERQIKAFDEKDLVAVSELPEFLRYWEQDNPQLKVEGKKRRATKEASVQTDLFINTFGAPPVQAERTPLLKKVAGHQAPLLKASKLASLQQTLNNAVEQLQVHRENVLNPDWLQSIDYLLITLQKQRRRMYPQYKYKLHNPDLTSIGDNSREDPPPTGLKLNDYLHEVYEFYRKNSSKSAEEKNNISFLGEFAQEAIEEQKKVEPLGYSDYRKFLEDIFQFTGTKSADAILRSSRLSRSVGNQLTLEGFITMIREQMRNSTVLNETSIAEFVKERIHSVEEKHLRQKGQDSKNINKVRPVIIRSPKKRKGSTDVASELPSAQTLMMYSGRDSPYEIKLKKGITSPAYRRRPSKNQTPVAGNSFKKKETFSPYREHPIVTSFARDSAEHGGFKKKGKGYLPRESQN